MTCARLVLWCVVPLLIGHVAAAQERPEVDGAPEALVEDPDVEAILAIRRAVEEAERRMDADALGSLFADDVVMLPGRPGETRGIEEIVDFHRRLYERFERFDVDFSTESIMILANLAAEGGSYTGTLVPTGGEPRDAAGEYLYVYTRDSAEGWQIHQMSWGGSLIQWRPDMQEDHPAAPDVIEAEIRVLHAESGALMEAQDAEALAQHFASDAEVIPPNQPPVQGREAIAQMWRGMFQAPDLSLERSIEGIVVVSSGDAAFVRGHYTLTMTTPQGPVRDEGESLVVFRRIDGDWKVATEILSSSIPRQ